MLNLMRDVVSDLFSKLAWVPDDAPGTEGHAALRDGSTDQAFVVRSQHLLGQKTR